MKKSILSLKFVSLVAIAIWLQPNPVLAVGYSITDLGASFVPSDINDFGQIAGNYGGNAGIWNKGNFLSNGGGWVRSINNSVQTVGSSGAYATLWASGNTQNLGTLGGSNSNAYAINNAGQVAGSSITAPIAGFHYLHAASWENGTIRDLGTLGGYSSQATDINDFGQIVGFSRTNTLLSSTTHAFLYANGVMNDLSPGMGNSSATSINNNGQVAGYASHDNGTRYIATIWSSGSITGLGTLGGTYSYAFDINNMGQAVGYAGTGRGLDHAFLWQDGVMTDLNSLVQKTDWELWSADAINDKGFIVGRGFLNGEEHGYLLTSDNSQPVPEPSTFILFGTGVGALALFKKRKSRPEQ